GCGCSCCSARQHIQIGRRAERRWGRARRDGGSRAIDEGRSCCHLHPIQWLHCVHHLLCLEIDEIGVLVETPSILLVCPLQFDVCFSGYGRPFCQEREMISDGHRELSGKFA
ncbi:hypothetical protein PENTCL1PPCAC_30021, partial [Pristionchus entomophagus]